MKHCKKTIDINQGGHKVFFITLLRPDHTPFDLTGITEITVSLPCDDPNNPNTLKQEFKLSTGEVYIASVLGGKLQVTCSATKTSLLKIGEDQACEIALVSTDVADPVLVDIQDSITVHKRLFTE
jgi:hypothetical protein